MAGTMSTVDDLRQELASSRERLLAAIAGVSEEQFKRRPVAVDGEPRSWSMAKVLAHLLQQDKPRKRGASRRALQEDGAYTDNGGIAGGYERGVQAGRVARPGAAADPRPAGFAA